MVLARPPSSNSSRSPKKVFGDRSNLTKNNMYQYHLRVPQLFQLSCKVQVLAFLIILFDFRSVVGRDVWSSGPD